MMAKRYAYDYEEYEEGKGPSVMVEEILADPEFAGVTDLTIGSWGSAYEDDCQPIIDGIVENAGELWQAVGSAAGLKGADHQGKHRTGIGRDHP